jgi:hypothetical protein
MSGLRSLPIDEILGRGSIMESDIPPFRRVLYEDGIITAEEAELLFHLNTSCSVKPPAWSELFIEGITDYIVYQERPQGYLTASNAHWLIDRVSDNGQIRSRGNLDLVVHVLDKARWAPVSLATFALAQVKDAVLSGKGPLRPGSSVEPKQITDPEVDLIRRIIYAFGGDGHVAVTREEADVLFDIDEAIADGPPNPAWTDLFVKAVANVIMAASGYAVPSREEAMRREASLDAPEQKTSVLAFLLAMVHTNLDAVKDAYHNQTTEERALARLEHQRIEIITNETITEVEASWLASRIGRDGKLSPSEHALVAYLKQESTSIHPTLVEFVNRLGVAAA